VVREVPGRRDRGGHVATQLLTPGERFGWVFRGGTGGRAFPKPPPELEPVPERVIAEAERALIRRASRVRSVVITGSGFAAVFAGGAWLASGASASVAVELWALTGVMVLAVVGGVVMALRQHAALLSKVDKIRTRNEERHRKAKARWEAERERFTEREERKRSSKLKWSAARTASESGRVDVIGGNLWGWEAFLTVFGASMLRSRGSLTVVDLSGEAVCRELAWLVGSAGESVDLQLLPSDLATSDLLDGLDRRQLVDALVESLPAGNDSHSGAGRADDARILGAVVRALGDDVSLRRMTAAVRVLLDEPSDGVLTAEERVRVADGLFSTRYREHVHDRLRRIESSLYPLEELGVRYAARRPAKLSCLAMSSDGHSARTRLLDELIVQWLTRRIANRPEPVRTLIIAGADDLAVRHLERLADVCDRRDVRLVVLFRHFRDTAAQVLGSGSVAFLRLGAYEDATRAANFIGREYRFEVTQLTRTLGGGRTHVEATTEGKVRGESGADGTARGGSLADVIPIPSTWSRSEIRNWSVSRSWGTTKSYAEATNWATATATQRVHDYRVEPRTLQDLPDYAMLLVESAPGGPTVRLVECNPDIISLPGVSMEPLPGVDA
jgi:heme exporter protein D